MGCDIHFYVEYREMEQKQKALISIHDTRQPLPWASDLVPNPYYYIGAEEQDFYNQPMHLRRWYERRNYDLFHRLADVRGYSRTDPPLAEPRGLPEDVCVAVKKVSDHWNGDGHSHSYFLLTELVNADWKMIDIASEWFQTLEDMKELAHEKCARNFDLVRAVFWFDN